MNKVFACNIGECDFNNELINKWLNSLSSITINKMNRYVKFNDKKRCVVGRLLIHYMRKSFLGDCIVDTMIQNDVFGKPYLNAVAKDKRQIEFNISHSGDWVIGAVSDQPIGIDIEEIKQFDITIGKNYFTQDEYDYIYDFPELQLVHFYQIWCLKESCLKCAGTGLSGNLLGIDVYKQGSFCKSINLDRIGVSYLDLLSFDSNYVVALCAKNRSQNIQIKKISILNALREILE